MNWRSYLAQQQKDREQKKRYYGSMGSATVRGIRSYLTRPYKAPNIQQSFEGIGKHLKDIENLTRQ